MKNAEWKLNRKEITEELLYFLYRNRNSNISGNYLKEKFNLKTIQLQMVIHDLRVDSEPLICKGNKGYSYSTNKDDIRVYVTQLSNRCKSIESAVNGLRTSLNTEEIISEEV